ncbi:methylamine dehydrogenase accessory protein MauD [Faunimonas sp. B44]|uniref:methylamine dehydrogenase accessory protein MauD n=1 Tax=Faunimonas sp. B44 TaxID=3461493 RepID=UPI00404510E2
MVEALVVSQILLWLTIVGMGVVIFALVRQVGILHERISPMGALVTDKGPEVGDLAPSLTVNDIAGRAVQIGRPAAHAKGRLLLFVSPSCPICKKLLPIAKSFSRGERLEVVLVGDGDLEEQRRMIREHGLEGETYVNAPQVGMAFQVGKLPYAILIDADGVIRAKGLVNSREHLESLAIAQETGYGSIQDYLRARGFVRDDAAEPAPLSAA